MNIDELSEFETAMVLEHRAKLSAEKANDEWRRLALRLAYEYETWLQEEGRGSTFSTFVNEFNYDEHDASQVFKAVEQCRKSIPAKG